MKLSDADKENIEVLESLDVDEQALLILICTYFGYRVTYRDGRPGFAPDHALLETIRRA